MMLLKGKQLSSRKWFVSMEYVLEKDRTELELVSLDMLVREDSFVRVIDAFVDKIIKDQFSFKNSYCPVKGKPYNPLTLTKLIMYGYVTGVKSSRKLAQLTIVNLEVIWLVKGVQPDYRAIIDFKEKNRESLITIITDFMDFCKNDLELVF